MGEPLTGRLVIKPDATIPFMITGDDDAHLFLYTDTGFGFITVISNLYTKNKNGKVVINIPDSQSAKLMPPEYVCHPESDLIAIITTAGRFLIFPVSEMPKLEKGKGNKIIGIPKDQLVIPGAERVKLLKVISDDDTVIVHAGKRFLKLKPANQESYRGKRGYRGKKLPRGYQNVHAIEIEKNAIPLK